MRVVSLRGGIGLLDDDGVVAILDVPFHSLGDYLSVFPIASLAQHRVIERKPYDELDLESYGQRACVWGIGLNYRSKMETTGRSRPANPTLFIKAPSAFVPGMAVDLPRGSRQVDYEAEVAVLIGTTIFEGTVHDATGAIAGVTVANDVTARDVMRTTGNPSLAKSFPGFGQVGAVVLTADRLGPLDDIIVSSSVNGELRQHDSTSGLLYPLPELVALMSQYAVLRPGDIIMSGTPAGTGDERGVYLDDGDTVEVHIDDLPMITTRFQSPAA